MPKRKSDATEDARARTRPAAADVAERAVAEDGDAAGAGRPSRPERVGAGGRARDGDRRRRCTVDAVAPESRQPSLSSPCAVSRRRRLTCARTSEEHHEEEGGWSLAARVLSVLLLLLAGAALGIWGGAEARAAAAVGDAAGGGLADAGQKRRRGAGLAALQARVDEGLGGVESPLRRPRQAPDDVDARIKRGGRIGGDPARRPRSRRCKQTGRRRSTARTRASGSRSSTRR